MKQGFYEKLRRWMEARPGRIPAAKLLTGLLPALVYGAYPLLLGYLWAFRQPELLRSVLVPAAGFLIVTVLRAGLNFPRPYEVLGIPPLVEKETAGKSFPSRHAACAGVIAVTALKTLPPMGVFLSLVALGICLSRVLAGVHFLRDVVAGLLLGAGIGVLGMYVI